MLPVLARMTGMRHHTKLSVEMGSHKHFSFDWSGTEILLISASQIARIIGVSRWSPG
jgi:hypothetical protein